MTGPIIPASQWPEDAYLHTWYGQPKQRKSETQHV